MTADARQRRRRRPSRALAFVLALVPAVASASSTAVASSSSPLSSTLQKLADDFRRSPYPRALIVAGTKGAVADFIAQRTEASGRSLVKTEGNLGIRKVSPGATWVQNSSGEHYSYRRTLAFIIYGGVYQGAALEYIFNDLFSRLFGNDGAISTLRKVLFNQLFVAPFVTLPVAYIVRGAVVLRAGPFASLKKYGEDATRRPRNGGGGNVWGGNVLLAFWSVWTPVNCILFGLVPPEWRISFNQVVSLLWTVVLSRMSRMAPKGGEEMEEEG